MAPKIAVIGSGPVALTCIEELVQKGSQPDLYLPVEKEFHGEYSSLKPLILKDRFIKPHVYTINEENFPLVQDRTSIYEVNRIGGLSEIWGGVFLPSHPSEKCFKDLSNSEIKEITEEILAKRDFKGDKTLINEYLNAREKLIFNTTKIPIFEEKEGLDIWSARKDFQNLVRVAKLNTYGSAVKIKQTGYKTKIVYLDGSSYEKESDDYDWVFIGAGPIGDAKIILNSIPNLNQIDVEDTSVFYTVRLGNARTSNFERLVPIRVRADFTRRRVFYSQEYLISQQLVAAIKFKKAHKMLQYVSRILRSWMTIEMNFLPQENSATIEIKKTSRKFLSKGKKRFPIFFVLPQISFKPLSISSLIGIRAAAGSGQHSGAFVSNNSEGAFLNVYPDILISRVSFLGASSLNRLPTGPITLAAMTNALSVTRKILSKF